MKWGNHHRIYYFVTDSTGTFLTHPDKNRIINKKLQDYVTNDQESICQGMIADRKDYTGNVELEIETIESYVSYHPIKYTTWTVGLVFPKVIMEIVSYVIGGLLLFFIVIGILVVLVSGRNAIRKASFPIRLLALSADDVAKGNFRTPLPPLNSRDEIQLLRDSFQKMQQSLYDHFFHGAPSERAFAQPP